MSELTLHERLDAQHTEELLTNYSGDYETWLEERIAKLEAIKETWICDLLNSGRAGNRKTALMHISAMVFKYEDF